VLKTNLDGGISFFTAALLSLTLSLAATLPAADLPGAKKGSAKSVSSPAAVVPSLKDVVLFTVNAAKHKALARMEADGTCKRYLSQIAGRGWVSSLPLENHSDDLAGVGSPDGQWIAFYSRRSGALNLWLAHADGNGAEALTSEDVDIADDGALLREQAYFSPDSSKIAFVMHGDLWLLSLGSRDLVTLSKGQGVGAITWSPNGRWIAYTQGASLRRVNVDGSAPEMLASGLVTYPTVAWVGDADKGSLLFFGRGLQRVSLDKKVDLLWPTLQRPNRVQATADKAVVLSQLSDGSSQVFCVDLAKGHGEQVTLSGAQDALFLPDGKGFVFSRNGMLWRCALDGAQAKPITDASASSPWVGRLAPGECH
jgi:Tol biopolymer transport system component